MRAFKDKDDLAEWAANLFDKHGLRQPESYSAEELKEFCPEVPADFIDAHVKRRDGK